MSKKFTNLVASMISDKTLVDLQYQKLQAIYQQNNMVCLSDNEYQYKTINVMNQPDANFVNPQWNSYKNLRDIVNCNQDIKYFTGNLFLLLPYINNPLQELDTTTFNFTFAHYHQNLYDHRYSTYVSCCFEKAYNYWDRIGDLLYSFYPSLITNIRSVDFVRIVDAIYSIGERDPNFLWLYNYRLNQYDQLNSYRRNIVHYYQYETTYHDDFIRNTSNIPGLTAIWDEKSRMPTFFREHLEFACDGCEQTYLYLYKVINHRNANGNPNPPTPVQP